MKVSVLVLMIFVAPAFVLARPQPGQRLIGTTTATSASSPAVKEGRLVVLVTYGDIDNTPADDVYIEAHGYVVRDKAEKSFVLKMAHSGRYEATLPPGAFDVFVSEGTSVPACKRVLVAPGSMEQWTLKLKVDYVFTEK